MVKGYKLLLLSLIFIGIFIISPVTTFAQSANNYGLRAATGSQTGQVVLTWMTSPDVTNYDLVYGTTPGNFLYGAQNIGNTGGYTVNHLEAGRVYYFALLPKRDNQPLSWTGQVSAKAAGRSNATAMKPSPNMARTAASAPDTQKVTGGPISTSYMFKAFSGDNSGEVKLTWDKKMADNFDVVYSESGSPFKYGATNLGNVNSYVVKSLEPGKRYDFSLIIKRGDSYQTMTERVSAIAASGQKVVSASSSTNNNLTREGFTDMSGPAGKQMLRATTGPNSKEITLMWNKDINFNNYDIVYGLSSREYMFGANSVGNVENYIVRSLNPGTRYYFSILPKRDNNPSTWSDEVSLKAR